MYKVIFNYLKIQNLSSIKPLFPYIFCIDSKVIYQNLHFANEVLGRGKHDTTAACLQGEVEQVYNKVGTQYFAWLNKLLDTVICWAHCVLDICLLLLFQVLNVTSKYVNIFISPLPEGGGGYTVLPLSVLPSVQDIFRRIFLSNCWWQKSDIWLQASYRHPISWEAFLDPSDSYFLFADLVGFYAHWTYMHIFRYIFLSNYWWQKSDIWSQASYRHPISWESFLDPSDS